MVVMPVSIASTGVGAFNRTNFTGRNERNDSEEVINNQVAKPSNLAKVPVVVMIAMSPAMLNAKAPVTGLAGTEGAKTELVTVLPSSMEEIDEMTTFTTGFSAPEAMQSTPPFGEKALTHSKIQHSAQFSVRGVKYNIVYTGLPKDNNEVRHLYVFPQGYNSNAKKWLPEVNELIYHDLGSGKEFCGVITESIVETNNGQKKILREIKLPDNIAQGVIDLLANYSKYENYTSVKYTKTQSASLRPTQTLDW